MFLRYFVEISLPFAQVEEALLRSPQVWLPGLAEGANGHGTRLMADLGLGSPKRRLTKRVEVEVGEAKRLGPATHLPLSWRATGTPALFPTLDAHIEVAPLGEWRTQLSLSGTYRPPLGAVGRAADRALLHRVAESTVKDLVDRMAAAIETRVERADEPSGAGGGK